MARSAVWTGIVPAIRKADLQNGAPAPDFLPKPLWLPYRQGKGSPIPGMLPASPWYSGTPRCGLPSEASAKVPHPAGIEQVQNAYGFLQEKPHGSLGLRFPQTVENAFRHGFSHLVVSMVTGHAIGANAPDTFPSLPHIVKQDGPSQSQGTVTVVQGMPDMAPYIKGMEARILRDTHKIEKLRQNGDAFIGSLFLIRHDIPARPLWTMRFMP